MHNSLSLYLHQVLENICVVESLQNGDKDPYS